MLDQQQPARVSTHAGHDWSLVLAGGEGSRLRSLTMTESGVAVPKQFCAFGGEVSLLHDALRRSDSVTTPERTCVVVSEHHRLWWQALDLRIPAENLIRQPRNRGTATGILLPLLQVLHRDPNAGLLVLPSDHFVRNEGALASSLRAAMRSVREHTDRIVMLGISPEEADPELGYIVAAGDGSADLRSVAEFVEKPSPAVARALIERGGVWNSFIFAAHGATLLRAFEERCPRLVTEMRHIIASSEHLAQHKLLIDLYERAPDLDFSRDILQRSPKMLGVLTVPPCGWSDLGTPRRLTEALIHVRPKSEPSERSTSGHTPFVDLTQLCPPKYAAG